MQNSPLASEQFDRMIAHLAANDVDTSTPTLALGDIVQPPEAVSGTETRPGTPLQEPQFGAARSLSTSL